MPRGLFNWTGLLT